MNKELEITKEKLNTLEQAWDNISAIGKRRTGLIIFSPVIFIFQKKMWLTLTDWATKGKVQSFTS